MLATLVVLLRPLGLLCSGHGAVALENVAPASAVVGSSAHGQASAPPHKRSTVLGPARQGVAGLANGLDRRAARHGRAKTSIACT